jgi:hypothetical protein
LYTASLQRHGHPGPGESSAYGLVMRGRRSSPIDDELAGDGRDRRRNAGALRRREVYLMNSISR